MTYLVEGVRKVGTGGNQVRRIGEYETREEAIEAAEQLIDACLLDAWQPGMTAAELRSSFESRGEIPVIFNDREGMQSAVWFDYEEHAASRCVSISAREAAATAD